MRKWNRSFFWRTRGAASGIDKMTDAACLQAEACLTAAFDGEADEAALASARTHLKNCANCARRWSEWEKTRLLLRSVPAPAAPSPLLTQVLLSCRLSASQSEKTQAAIAPGEREVLRAALADYLESPAEAFEDATPENAPLARFIQTVPVPPELQNQILQRTSAAPKSWWVSLLPAAQDAVSDCRVAWSTPRPVRWGMGLAVPALAAWLIFAGQTEYIQPENVAEIAPPVAVAPNAQVASEPPAPKATASMPASGDSGWLQPLKGAIKRAANSLPATAPQKVEPARSVVAASATVRPRVVAAPSGARPRLVEASVAKPSVKKIKKVIRRAAGLAKARVAPAVDIVESPRVQAVAVAATSPANRPALKRIRRTNDGARHQISNPVALPSRLAKLTELDFEEAFIAVTSVRDDRPEDVRRALDEFRAAVLSEPVESEDDFDDL